MAKNKIDIVFEKGGAGSGHRGHSGRPGKRGGSMPGGSGGSASSEGSGLEQRIASGKVKKGDKFHFSSFDYEGSVEVELEKKIRGKTYYKLRGKDWFLVEFAKAEDIRERGKVLT